MAKLKVYRTPIGFHDAYVAAPSQKAALAAWGTDRNLFAQGSAEIVTDENLSREPLARPGTIVKRSRGTAAEQMAALPPDHERSRRPKMEPKGTPRRNAMPRPDRKALDHAEHTLAKLQEETQKSRSALEKRIAELKVELADLTQSQRRELASAEQERDTLATLYEAALKRWRSAR